MQLAHVVMSHSQCGEGSTQHAGSGEVSRVAQTMALCPAGEYTIRGLSDSSIKLGCSLSVDLFRV